MRSALALLLACTLFAGACSGGDEPPHVTFGGATEGCDGEPPCLNANTSDGQAWGMRFIHKLTKGEPVVSIRVLFDGGAKAWNDRSVHAAWMAMTLLTWYGGGDHVGADFRAAQARIGAQFSAGVGLDFSHASIAVPVSHFDQGFDLLAGATRAPVFWRLKQQAIDQVRSVYMQGFELDEPDAAAARAAWQLVFAGHRYNLAAETLDMVASVSKDDVATAFNALRGADRMTVVVVGDVQRARVEKRIQDLHAPLIAGADLQPLSPVQPSLERTVILPYPDSPAWHVTGCFAAPSPTHPDYLPLLLALRVLDNLLFDDLRERDALVYDTGAVLYDYRANYGTVWLSTAQPGAAMSAYHALLARVSRDGLEPSLLEAARAQYLTEFLADRESTSSIAWTLGNWQLTAGDRTLADEHVRSLARVTPEDAARVLGQYLADIRYAAAGDGEPVDEALLLGSQ